jgi:hypothetical protein
MFNIYNFYLIQRLMNSMCSPQVKSAPMVRCECNKYNPLKQTDLLVALCTDSVRNLTLYRVYKNDYTLYNTER